VTVTIAGGSTSAIRTVVDSSGSFLDVVNESHEFFPGAIPVGIYQVQVTDGAIVATVNIVVGTQTAS
jgi:hypothetical protein